MWFNGTSMSEKARRALENEKITIVSHISGYIHTLYSQATIDPSAYSYFSTRLREFLVTDLTIPVFINFLRFKSKYKSLFQYCCCNSGKKRYIDLEKMFEYEHTSRYKVSTDSRESLIAEIEGEEFHLSPIQGKLIFNDVESLINRSKGQSPDEIEDGLLRMYTDVPEEIIRSMFRDLRAFISTQPKLPDPGKEYVRSSVPEISVSDSREVIKDKIIAMSGESEMSMLTLYISRQMDKIDWLPFVKAAIERNPVCFGDLAGKSFTEAYDILNGMAGESIYDGQRLALPDEVWNFSRGDGIEKALLMADLILHRDRKAEVRIDIDGNRVMLRTGKNDYMFNSLKDFRKSILINGTGYSIS
jgi:hypothetical protein